MERIHLYFKKHGVEEKNIPKAFFIYKGIGVILTLVTYGICYRYNPVVAISKIQPFNRWNVILRGKFPGFYKKTEEIIETKTKLIGNSKYLKPIADFFRLNPQRATFAVGENFVFDKLTMPITVPFQFWVATHWLKSDKKYGKDQNINIKDTLNMIKTKKSWYSHYNRNKEMKSD